MSRSAEDHVQETRKERRIESVNRFETGETGISHSFRIFFNLSSYSGVTGAFDTLRNEHNANGEAGDHVAENKGALVSWQPVGNWHATL